MAGTDELVDERGPSNEPRNNEPEEEDSTADRPRRLRRVFAMGTIIFPGGSHLYVRRHTTAALIVAGEAVGLSLLLGTQGESRITGLILLVSMVFCDMLGGQKGVGTHNAGEPVAAGRQTYNGFFMLTVTLLAALVFAPLIFKPEPQPIPSLPNTPHSGEPGETQFTQPSLGLNPLQDYHNFLQAGPQEGCPDSVIDEPSLMPVAPEVEPCQLDDPDPVDGTGTVLPD